MAGQPTFLLDGQACPVLRKGFNGGYKDRRIQVTGEERFTEEPMKNAYSHPHDALQYVAHESGGVQAMLAEQMRNLPQPKTVDYSRHIDAEMGL